MYKHILIALDLEGVNNVVGEHYSGLSKSTEQYEIAQKQAVLEVNAAADALFAAGAESVTLWDNHGGGDNISEEWIDPRMKRLNPDYSKYRMYFCEGAGYDCICYFGYHAMEGTLNGVLAHTMSSKVMQDWKYDGVHIGEVDIDSWIAASHGIPSVFFASDAQGCRQAKRSIPDIVTVTTKTGTSRNSAIFRDNDELLAEIREKIVEAVSAEHPLRKMPLPSTMEKSWKRMEDAANALKRVRGRGIEADHPDDEILGKGAHSVVMQVRSVEDFLKCI